MTDQARSPSDRRRGVVQASGVSAAAALLDATPERDDTILLRDPFED